MVNLGIGNDFLSSWLVVDLGMYIESSVGDLLCS